MKIENDLSYQEGIWAAGNMAKNIDKTIYETLFYAIQVKQELIDNFEKEFGFSREMEIPDGNYSYNLGILDALKKIHEDEESNNKTSV